MEKQIRLVNWLALFHEMWSSYCGSSTSFQSLTRNAGTLERIPLESASPVFIGILLWRTLNNKSFSHVCVFKTRCTSYPSESQYRPCFLSSPAQLLYTLCVSDAPGSGASLPRASLTFEVVNKSQSDTGVDVI